MSRPTRGQKQHQQAKRKQKQPQQPYQRETTKARARAAAAAAAALHAASGAPFLAASAVAGRALAAAAAAAAPLAPLPPKKGRRRMPQTHRSQESELRNKFAVWRSGRPSVRYGCQHIIRFTYNVKYVAGGVRHFDVPKLFHKL
jgi:hypothetical protein